MLPLAYGSAEVTRILRFHFWRGGKGGDSSKWTCVKTLY